MNSENNKLFTIKQIRKKLLPIYEQAAELQGVDLKIIAIEGENYQKNSMVHLVHKNRVAISLSRAETEGEIKDFFETVRIIKAELPNTRIG